MNTNKNSSFPITRWTRIVYALDPAHPRVQAAFAELFQRYWFPIYAYLRRSGIDHNDAEDFTQAFFLYAYEHRTFQKADRGRGRFRTFILGCLQNFLHDDYRHRTAAKRGGGALVIEIDGVSAKERYAMEPADDSLSPEKLFEQKLALEVYNGAMAELEAEAVDEGRGAIFAALRPYLNQDDDGPIESYRAISVRLNISAGTLKSHAYRFRDRLKKLLIARVGHIVASEDDVKSEMQALDEAL